MSQSQNNINNTLNYLAAKMPSAKQNHSNPIESLSLDDIIYLQSYLEQLKNKKINQLNQNQLNQSNQFEPVAREMPVDWRTRTTPSSSSHVPQQELPGQRGSLYTRNGKKSQAPISLDNNNINDYYNPYECGSRQKSLGPMYKETYTGPYQNDAVALNQMGISQNLHMEEFPGKVRNVNIESLLMQREGTRLPGNKKIMENEHDRFNTLPFNPQNHENIVWADGMPRGGYATRVERTEY